MMFENYFRPSFLHSGPFIVDMMLPDITLPQFVSLLLPSNPFYAILMRTRNMPLC